MSVPVNHNFGVLMSESAASGKLYFARHRDRVDSFFKLMPLVRVVLARQVCLCPSYSYRTSSTSKLGHFCAFVTQRTLECSPSLALPPALTTPRLLASWTLPAAPSLRYRQLEQRHGHHAI